MEKRARNAGFTLLEVMIAMGILAVGATSVLSIFVLAVRWQTDRVESNKITEIHNFARQHAEVVFNSFDPRAAQGTAKTSVPPKVVADFTDPGGASQSKDPLILEGLRRFPGYRYEILFDDNPLAVGGSSVVATIRIYRLSGQLDQQISFMPEFLTRSGTPVQEFWASPSMERRNRERTANKKN